MTCCLEGLILVVPSLERIYKWEFSDLRRSDFSSCWDLSPIKLTSDLVVESDDSA